MTSLVFNAIINARKKVEENIESHMLQHKCVNKEKSFVKYWKPKGKTIILVQSEVTHFYNNYFCSTKIGVVLECEKVSCEMSCEIKSFNSTSPLQVQSIGSAHRKRVLQFFVLKLQSVHTPSSENGPVECKNEFLRLKCQRAWATFQ